MSNIGTEKPVDVVREKDVMMYFNTIHSKRFLYSDCFGVVESQDVRAANEKYTSMVGDAERHSKELTQKDGALQSLQSQLSKMRQEKTNADIQLRQANTGLAENAAELNAVKENVKVGSDAHKAQHAILRLFRLDYSPGVK